MSGTPKLRNDCFALPAGVDWTPVDTALARLRDGLAPVTGAETVPLDRALGRVLAEPLVAARANPPSANTAVDGYGLRHADLPDAGEVTLQLAQGRAAAGAPFAGSLPPGHAVRVLTGAVLPEGVDTVILQEDVTAAGGAIRFRAGLRRGANCRRAGEDVAAGAQALPGGHMLRPQDLALAAALGHGALAVRAPLRVAVLSTGDELRPAGAAALPHQTFDANRPMLLALLARWGMVPVDLGAAADDAGQVRARLERGAAQADAVIATGGASAGDEDHVSAVLRASGKLETWRIAMKPGRPLALANWDGVPVFGLPGNPVAAFVCALVFARPALLLLAGAGWRAPLALTVPAAFSKRKKPGRREYLRARLDAQGRAEVFASEGSGRISGLSWAEGLVELPDAALDVAPGTPVRYLPFAGFGV
ncbi:molybdopterin molybdenumtransferase MoeA [Rhodobacteraceae bacterium 2CG4]|uniref:Molybdopterin molybdenumtransferase n=1 Tax=Halovulum marinum TaxID=2662447 RepID=A0A6L5YVA9_9RHOB|nr:gephyrin-like molybdotransferase Glp [Halovulum marinum]MSU88197.1 molybdopterin molybdenumtransferase MoeA [Halovulum marinum]